MWFVYSLCSWFLAVTVHAVLCRLSLPFGTVARFFIAGSGVGISLSCFVCASHGIYSVETFSALSAYGFLCELYLFLSTLAMASISSNLLIRLKGNRLQEQDLIAMYDADRMVAVRIERLLAAGLLAEDSGRLHLTRAGTRIVTGFQRLRAFCRDFERIDTGAERRGG